MSLDEWVGHGIPDEIIDLAIVWIAKLDSQNATESEKREFYQWLDDDPLHRWAFEELSEIWAKTSLLKDKAHLIEQSQVLHFPAPTNHDSEKANSWFKTPSYLAILFISVGLLLPLIF